MKRGPRLLTPVRLSFSRLALNRAANVAGKAGG